jgi:uncharacterized membrane protein
MDGGAWAKVHGAAVHFPIALVVCSGLLEASACLPGTPSLRRGLQSAGYWTILLGALGTVPAVVSGLVMSRGVVLGHDALRLHHLFAWPAFALIVGLGVWRALAGEFAPGRAPAGYLAAVAAACALILGAGYWGGEILLAR